MQAQPIIFRSIQTLGAKRSPEPASAPQEVQRPTQLPAFRKQELADTRAIANRVQDNSRSMRLEMMLRRQRSNGLNALLNESRQRPAPLEYLSVGQTSEQRFVIINRSQAKPLSQKTFATLHHCAEAAAELEQTFAMDWLLELPSAEAMEQTEAIIQAHGWREWVEMEMERGIA